MRLFSRASGLSFKPWPKRLLGQMIALILMALLLAQGISLWVLSNAHRKALEGHRQRALMRQLSAVVTMLEKTPIEQHARTLKAWKRPGLEFELKATTGIDKPDTPLEHRLARLLGRWVNVRDREALRVDMRIAHTRTHRHATDPHPKQFRPGADHHRLPPLEQLLIAIPQNNNRWLEVRAEAQVIPPLAAQQTVIFLVVSSILVLAILFWRLRAITRPLAQLTQAANDLGRRQKVPPLSERGPEDIQGTIIAFNRMNERLNRFVSERTQMLAALSHDLRTPLTSMRLRLELMPPGPEREQLLNSLEEMQQMSEATLAFIRESGDAEPTRQVDVTALISSICEDLLDTAANAGQQPQLQFEYTDEQVIACRPLSLKRALRNLIENAHKYAESAQIQVRRQTGEVTAEDRLIIEIQDTGPGIDEAQLEKVFEPFYRVESSRHRSSGGAGLGLAIARQIINNHGGDIRLSNHGNGLLVTVSLPFE